MLWTRASRSGPKVFREPSCRVSQHVAKTFSTPEMGKSGLYTVTLPQETNSPLIRDNPWFVRRCHEIAVSRILISSHELY
jgi:hypothetical protein